MRMGIPKAVLHIRGVTFLDNLCASLAGGGCEPVLAVVGDAAPAIRAGCRLTGVELVTNPDPARGQISSLWCALDAVPDVDGLIVVLVDQGGLEPNTIRVVCEGLEQKPIAVARYRGLAGHPTGFRRVVFEELRSSPVGQAGARFLVDAAAAADRVAWVDVRDPGVVRNLNRPEDLVQAGAAFPVEKP